MEQENLNLSNISFFEEKKKKKKIGNPKREDEGEDDFGRKFKNKKMKKKKTTIENPSAMKPMNRIENREWRIENGFWRELERAVVSFHFSITLLLFQFYLGVSEEQKPMQSILAVGFFLSFYLCAVVGRNVLVSHLCSYL